ncbi:hypothetical protein ACWDBW_13445 [Streptomyces sp. NPDC001107]
MLGADQDSQDRCCKSKAGNRQTRPGGIAADGVHVVKGRQEFDVVRSAPSAIRPQPPSTWHLSPRAPHRWPVRTAPALAVTTSAIATHCGIDSPWERLLQHVQAAADAAGEIDWDIAVDSTVVRAHQHAAGARAEPPPAPAPKGAEVVEHRCETSWRSLLARLMEVVQEVRAWAARAAGSPAHST